MSCQKKKLLNIKKEVKRIFKQIKSDFYIHFIVIC